MSRYRAGLFIVDAVNLQIYSTGMREPLDFTQVHTHYTLHTRMYTWERERRGRKHLWKHMHKPATRVCSCLHTHTHPPTHACTQRQTYRMHAETNIHKHTRTHTNAHRHTHTHMVPVAPCMGQLVGHVPHWSTPSTLQWFCSSVGTHSSMWISMSVHRVWLHSCGSRYVCTLAWERRV